jgi:hypothetical protein
VKGVGKKAAAILLVIVAVSAALVFTANLNTFFPPSIPTNIYQPTVPAAGERVVCIAFDDGWKSHLDVAQTLQSYNFTATFPIITSYVGYSAYLNWDDIASLAQKGNDIASHTQTHCNLSAVDDATLQMELLGSQQVLRSKGYAADVLIYPYGEAANNVTVRNMVATYYLLARGTEPGKCDLNMFDRYNVASYSIYHNTSLTEFASYINGTQGNNITLLFYHKVNDENLDTAVSKEAFQAQMQYLKDSNCTVRTISEQFLKQK